MKRTFTMLIIAVLVIGVVAAFTDYIQYCSPCGSTTAPKQCTGYVKSIVRCSVPSFLFSCNLIKRITGWLLCPSCPQGYTLQKCEGAWFGIMKTAVCVKHETTKCGVMCDEGEEVTGYSSCIASTTKICCNVPNNNVTLLSPKNLTRVPANTTISIAASFEGVVKKVRIYFGDGTNKTFTPEPGTTIINTTHFYSAPGFYTIKVVVSSCAYCNNSVNSSSQRELVVLNNG